MVEVASPEARTVTEYFSYTGTLESVETVEVRARVGGYLTSVEFTESTNVEAGDVLFTIEKDQYEIAVGRAEAALARAEAAQTLAETRLRRTEDAFEDGAATDIELVEEQANLKQAQADVMTARQNLAEAQLNLSYTDVRTPISGRVDRHYVDEGNLVGRDEPTLLARIVMLDPMHVWFDVSESIALQYLSKGEDGSVDQDSPPVEVGLADEAGFPHAGQVDFVDSVVDESTGTLRVRAVLANTTGKLYPGLFARIRVPWETREDAIVIREEAIGTGLEGKYVLVVDETGLVQRRSVTLGERQGDGAIVVLGGLTHEDRYVVRGVQKARPGSVVDAQPFGPGAETGS